MPIFLIYMLYWVSLGKPCMFNGELIPDIEEGLSLPSSAAEALPELSPAEELEMRAKTIKLMADLTGNPLTPSRDNANEARDIARQMLTDPRQRPDFSTYKNETIAYLAGMVAQMNVQIVDELSDLKLYVVNKLVEEIETAKDPKTRVMALTKLGEIDGVDAFKKRSEITMMVKPIEEVEKELKTILEGIEYKILPEKSEKVA